MFGLRLLILAAVGEACFSQNQMEIPKKKTTSSPKGACTDIYDTETAISRLTSELETKVFGQPLATRTVINSFKAHWTNSDPRKALLLSFHGSTGTGKSHLAHLLAMSLFRGAEHSPSLNLILGSAFEEGDQEKQKTTLATNVRNAVSKCPRAVFIIDDADRLQEGVLDVLLPFTEFHESVNGLDYRKASFVLISSAGGKEVNDISIEHLEGGQRKESLHVKDFEKKVTNAVFNVGGGLRKSQLISRGVIDTFVPFLPLGRREVEHCVEDHLKHSGRHFDRELIQEVADSLQYFRGHFSSSGCKKVASRTDTKLLEEHVKILEAHHDDL